MPNNRNPTLTIIDMKSDYIQFELSDTDISVANALRRIMIAEVPTLAIDLVHFANNTTVLLDEIIAHRLGLIPLASSKDMGEWNYGHECDCEDYCNKCSVRFSLDCDFKEMTKDRPLHEQELALAVTSRDLVSTDPDVEAVLFSNEDEVHMSHDEGIVIALLGPGECTHLLTLSLILSLSRSHSLTHSLTQANTCSSRPSPRKAWAKSTQSGSLHALWRSSTIPS